MVLNEKEISDKEIQKMKGSLEKDHGREFTWEEAANAISDIKRLAHLVSELTTEEFSRQEKLKENPKGYHLDGDGICLICGHSASKENSWFDKYGLKCMLCQNAINTKIIPESIAKHRESWYSKHELESYFNIKKVDLNKYLKQSFLKERVIHNEKKKVHLQLFLIKDNKDVLPPKKLLQSRIVKVIRNGEEYYTQECWYEFAEKKLMKRLTKYKISYCLQDTLSKPIESGRFLFKVINPLFTSK